MNPLKELIVEVIYSVVPIAFLMLIIQLLMRFPLGDVVQFLLGTFFVFLGLLMFFLGTKIGIVPIGEMIGEYLPQAGKLARLLLIGGLLGFAITIAEPDVQILATQVDMVSNGYIPKILLIGAVAMGIGVYISIALFRLIKNIPIKYVLIVSYLIVFLLALVTPPDFLPVALDSGGVTTGPIVVPFIVALGIGIAGVFGGKRTSFGFVGLASVGPILAVMLLGVIFGR